MKNKSKPMHCKLTIRGGKISHRRQESTPHVFFDRMLTIEQVGHIISYLAQFPEPSSNSDAN